MNGIQENLKCESVLNVTALTGTKKDENRFYVYVYLDPRKPGKYKYGKYKFNHEPIYVGKGNRGRDYEIHKNKLLIRKLNKILLPLSVKLEECLTEKEAFELEIMLITTIGRIDLKTGPLCNFTNGGEGTSGIVMSEETRQKRSACRLGKKRPPRSKEWSMKISKANKGLVRSDEFKEKISKATKGKKKGPMPEETKRKIRETKSKKIYMVSEETRRKLSEAYKNAHKKRQGLGIPSSSTRPEVRAKISQTLKERNAKIRKLLKQTNFGKG